MIKKLLFTSLFTSILITSISFKSDDNNGFVSSEDFANMVNRIAWVDSVYNELSDDERVAQFFMVAAYSNGGKKHEEEISQLVQDHQIGGVIFFQGGPGRQAHMCNRLQSQAKVPMLVSIDGEWGLGMRLDSTISFPRQLTLGALTNNDLLYQMGYEIGMQCKRLGIHVNLAPVVDVNNNPNNPVINDRSFGEDKYNVALKGLAYMEGMQDAGIMACAKHFPGHGDTDKDSHHTLPTINHSMDRLTDIELFPFKILFANGIQGVMAAHLHIPALDDTENQAVSLSRKVTTELLKDSMDFQGLVFSDALGMKGVSDYHEPGEVDMRAFIAGNDILVFSEDVPTGIEKIQGAVKEGIITEEELKARVKKVLAAKYDLGLNNYEPIKIDSLYHDLNNWDAKLLRQELFEKAFTIAANKDDLLPFKTLNAEKFATVAIGSPKQNTFQNTVAKYVRPDHFNASKDAKKANFNRILAKADKYDYMIVSLHDMSKYNSKNYGLSEAARTFINELSAKTKVIITVFGSPYSLKYFDGIDWVINAYEENETTQNFAAQMLFGGIPAKGKLPITASSKYKFGMGYLDDNTYRFKHTVPEEVGLASNHIDLIDYLGREVVHTGVSPGCQILVAKEGKVIYNEAFGFHTYKRKNKVKKTDVYDIASVTKIASTLVSAMHLVDKDKINIDKTVGDHIDDLGSYSTIAPLKISDVLMHEAGLEGWIPFFTFITKNDTTYDYYLCNDTSGGFNIKVADSLYLYNDYDEYMWKRIRTSFINPKHKYTYSDLSFYTMKAIVEAQGKAPLDEFVSKNIYDPMGLQYITYRPLEKYKLSQVTPTELDTTFRKQLVHGHVHDPGAAMLGGVGGHAGIFSNATDLAAIMQMLLDDGKYGGQQYIKPETIAKFSKRQSKISRRAYGFDKPQTDPDKSNPCSDNTPPETFGHTGFTGTAAWADPVNDVVFVFLSNRVYPDATNWKIVNKNIRPRIQSIIYQAIEKAEEKE